MISVLDRTKFIGGSDIAAVMGMSRWKTPLQLWGEKTGKVEPADLSGVEAVELGTELEDFVAKKFERTTGMKVRRAPQVYEHKEHDFIRCQVDRLITGTDELLEVKTCSAWKSKEWDGEEIPQEYILQVQFQLGITGRSKGWIAVLIGGQSFRYKEIPFDSELFAQLVSNAIKFWDMVENEIPPMACGDDNESIVDIYPTASEQMQQIDELNSKIAHLQELKMHIAELENQQAAIEAEVKQVIGESAGFKTAEYVVKWTPQISKRLDVKMVKAEQPQIFEKYAKESVSRVLRITKNKEN